MCGETIDKPVECTKFSWQRRSKNSFVTTAFQACMLCFGACLDKIWHSGQILITDDKISNFNQFNTELTCIEHVWNNFDAK